MPEMTTFEILATGAFLMIGLPMILLALARLNERLLGGDPIAPVEDDRVIEARPLGRATSPYDWQNDEDLSIGDEPQWS